MELSSTLPPSVRLQHLWPTADLIEAIESGTTTRHVPAFPTWLAKVTPTYHWHWQHQEYLYKYLDKVTSGECKRLMIFIPPRHTKSETVTVRYPVWSLERRPTMRVIIGAYNQTLANKFSRKARRIAAELIPMSSSRAAVEEWDTKLGGGLRAVGVGGGITGQGGDLIVIDDPVKNREEAESETYREKVWEWYKDDLYTRLEPDGAIVLIMTRWHQDDLAGRLIEEMRDGGEYWDIVSLPALAEDNDPLGRKEGEALCPERYDEAALANIKMVLGERSFNALYQQRPSAREGNMFKVGNLEIVDVAPVEARRVRYWDKAATQGGGDFTAGVRIAVTPKRVFYIEDVVKGQWDTDERDSIIRQTAQLDGNQVSIGGEQEPGAAGKDSKLAFLRLLSGFSVTCAPASGSKEVRADPLSAQVNGGNVKLVKGGWNKAFIAELGEFPVGVHDDQVDAASGAFNMLAESNTVYVFRRAG